MWSECWLDEELRHILQSEEGGAAWEYGSQQILFVLHVSGKNMQSSSIFHVHSVWVNTILVEHLPF